MNGQGGIRTRGTVAGTPPFQGGAFSHSATCPVFVEPSTRACVRLRVSYSYPDPKNRPYPDAKESEGKSTTDNRMAKCTLY